MLNDVTIYFNYVLTQKKIVTAMSLFKNFKEITIIKCKWG